MSVSKATTPLRYIAQHLDWVYINQKYHPFCQMWKKEEQYLLNELLARIRSERVQVNQEADKYTSWYQTERDSYAPRKN